MQSPNLHGKRTVVEQRKRGYAPSGPSSDGVMLSETGMPVDAGQFLEGRRCVTEAVLGFGYGKPQNLEAALLKFSTLASIPSSTVIIL